MLSTTARTLGAARQRGLSIVELMVGVAVGLLVVAATAMMAATQMSDNRHMLLEVQVQQDLRAAMDTMSREIRRAGGRALAQNFVWWGVPEGADLKGWISGYGIEAAYPLTGSNSQIDYIYERTLFDPGQSGFRLSGGAVQMQSPSISRAFPWSDLTDTRALTVNPFVVTADHRGDPSPALPDAPQRIPCPKLCPVTNDTSCWPYLRLRHFEMTVDATAVSDPAVKRRMRAVVRPRNDELVVGAGLPYQAVCPT
ncbi:MAG: hypothetical protein IT501_09335 [Rubrivivax sp.]|nr:hypothetical protein [Rubrivivax sp.]